MVVVFKHLFYKNYVGLSFYPFIILRENHYKNDTILINHERIHLQQQKEMLIIPFYLWYVCEWLCRSMLYLNWYRAYLNISFEREAYANEHNLAYLDTRKRFAFMHYIFRPTPY